MAPESWLVSKLVYSLKLFITFLSTIASRSALLDCQPINFFIVDFHKGSVPLGEYALKKKSVSSDRFL